MMVLDIDYLGQRGAIGAFLLETASGCAIVDPGPASALPGLRARLAEQGLAVADLEAILLTHIHLDHAGATGTLVRENPRLRVYVHERGAPHLADPTRLLASAARLYGDAMERLWGEFLPVPRENLHALAGGEDVRLGARVLETAYTPGHAVHHLCYHDPASGIAFVGDTGGLRLDNARVVLPLTPPPDFDLEEWKRSLARIAAWRPERLVVTHFGFADDVPWHLNELERGLEDWTARVRASLAREATDDERARAFAAEVSAGLAGRLPAGELARYAAGAALEACWAGIARWVRKQGG
ncbi:MAG TPA: MBL fold metallo-hydrolase [Longimicrobiales bacterium]